MNLLDDGFSLVWIVGGWTLFLAFVVWAVKTAPWSRVWQKTISQHVMLAAALLLGLVWAFGASISGGLTFHFLLVSVLVVMFGPQLALLLATLALLAITLLGKAGPVIFGLNGVLMIGVPVLISWALVFLTFRFLDRNFFVFVLMNGFLAAAVASFATLMLAGGVMWLSEVQSVEMLMQSFFPYIPLMAIPEGVVAGMLVAGLVLLKPQWIGCYSDELYLKGK